MDLNKLFQIQDELDQAIVKKKGLEGQDLLPKKILALQVELGELANEWRGFKFWSEKQTPLQKWSGGCDKCDYWETKQNNRQSFSKCDCFNGLRPVNTVLEEYVDVLHFILSIGLELKIKIAYARETQSNKTNITKLFTSLFVGSGIIGSPESDDEINYLALMSDFIRLGQLLDFTWTEIEQAYLDKNKVNHARQESGY